MCADVLGRTLLAEVQDEGLDELLSDLRQLANTQPRNVLGLPYLDHLLEVFRFPVLASTAQDPQWISPPPPATEGTSPNNVGNATPARGNTVTSLAKSRSGLPVIQLTGTDSAVGKTSLCYLLTALAVLPQGYTGKGHGVIWLDTDGRFSATRLQCLLKNHLSNKFPRLSLHESNGICYEALQHVHVFRPQSSSQLISTLAHLPGYLLGTGGFATHFSGSRSLGLVVLDSATAFYWQDCFEAEITRFEALGAVEKADNRFPARISKTTSVIAELKKLRKLFDCTILFTSSLHTMSSTTSTSTSTAITTNDGRRLPEEAQPVSPWAAFATLSMSVTNEQVRQFAPQMSLEECQRDQTSRLAAVAKGRSIVSIDWSTSITWANGVQDVVNGLSRQGSFVMRITPFGIAAEE